MIPLGSLNMNKRKKSQNRVDLKERFLEGEALNIFKD